MEEPTKKMEAETGADGVGTPREPAPPARAAVRNFRGAPRALAIVCGLEARRASGKASDVWFQLYSM
jgi:hypothetical protein